MLDSVSLFYTRSPSKCFSERDDDLCPKGEELPCSSIAVGRIFEWIREGNTLDESNPTVDIEEAGRVGEDESIPCVSG